jgi:hypothetical protein
MDDVERNQTDGQGPILTAKPFRGTLRRSTQQGEEESNLLFRELGSFQCKIFMLATQGWTFKKISFSVAIF